MAEYAVAGSLPGCNKSCNALALPARTCLHEVCACSWPGAACPGRNDSPWRVRFRPNPDRLAQGMDIFVGSPDGSGTSFLRFEFSHLRSEAKNPRRASPPRGFNLSGAVQEK